jgi:hypothetical protein
MFCCNDAQNLMLNNLVVFFVKSNVTSIQQSTDLVLKLKEYRTAAVVGVVAI